MIAPKSMHLVERAAERLLRAGGPEGSAAQLLEADQRPVRPLPPAPPAVKLGETSSHSLGPAALVEPVQPPPPQSARASVEEVSELAPPDVRPIVDLAALERAGLFDSTR